MIALEAYPGLAARRMFDDAAGDALDAVICALPTASAWKRRARNFGMPPGVISCEGWIAGA